MLAFVYLAIYCSLAISAAGCIRRTRQYAKLPVHLRWELYPVPHEPSPLAVHGGSYFEESEWWTKPRRVNRVGELAVMAREILLLETVRKAKPSLWWRSQLFHSGVFLVIAAVGCDALGALVEPMALAGRVAGYIGLLAIVIGSLSLLWRRVLDREFDDYTHPADLAQLAALAIAALLLLAGCLQPDAPSVLQFARGVFSFDTELDLPAILTAGLLITAALLAYIPFSRMAHFIGKYFGYHSVRWDDAPNRGGKFGEELQENLRRKPTWSASHIAADGIKSWVDIAGENPTEVRR